MPVIIFCNLEKMAFTEGESHFFRHLQDYR